MMNCNCFDFLYPNRGSAFSNIANADIMPPCSYSNTTMWECRSYQHALYTNDLLGCEDICPKNCESYAFDFSISSLRWPNPDENALSSVCSTIVDVLQKRINRTDSSCSGMSKMASMVDGGGSMRIINDLMGCQAGTFHDPIQSYYELANFMVGYQFAEVYIYYRDFNLQVSRTTF